MVVGTGKIFVAVWLLDFTAAVVAYFCFRERLTRFWGWLRLGSALATLPMLLAAFGLAADRHLAIEVLVAYICWFMLALDYLSCLIREGTATLFLADAKRQGIAIEPEVIPEILWRTRIPAPQRWTKEFLKRVRFE